MSAPADISNDPQAGNPLPAGRPGSGVRVVTVPVLASDGARFNLRQEELAHQAGGTRQSVNAALRGFERRGWIQLQDRAVTVTQAAALRRFAGS